LSSTHVLIRQFVVIFMIFMIFKKLACSLFFSRSLVAFRQIKNNIERLKKMKRDVRVAMVMLLSQLLKVDINKQVELENEYLREELQTFKAQFKQTGKRLIFTDEQRKILAIKGKALGKRMRDVVTIVRPETILKWYRNLVAAKFDSAKSPKRKVGRPRTPIDIARLVLLFARENSSWGYTRISGTLGNLGHKLSSTTVANIMKRNGLNPSGDRTPRGMSWAEFIRIHKEVIWGSDFFSVEVLTFSGLVTFYVLFFINLKTKKIVIGGISDHPDGEWMAQIARNVTGWDGKLENAKYIIHDNDKKYPPQFNKIMDGSGVKPVKLPIMSPNLNAYSERWVRSIKEDCLKYFIPFGEKSLKRIVSSYVEHFHEERNHQGLGNAIPFPAEHVGLTSGKIKTKKRMGGLLKYYYREVA